MSKIPCSTAPDMEMGGMCSVNPDGVCIRGGTKISASGGYGLASLGFPTDQCMSFPLFVKPHQPYTISGWRTSNNINPLRLSQGL